MQVFLDESGYTGQHLLDLNQPAFSIATIGFSEEECVNLKARHFSGIRATELKYASMARRRNQQKMVIQFLHEILDRRQMVKVSMAHKEFVVVTKMVDLLTENHAHLSGIDLYVDGSHLALSNMLYFGLPAVCGRAHFDRLLRAFQSALIDRNYTTFTEFRNLLFDSRLNEQQREWLAYFRVPVLEFGYRLFQEIGGDEPLELALTCGAYLMGSWRYENRDDPIELIHDQSSNMMQLKHIWEFFMSMDRKPFDRQRAHGPMTVYPIALEKTTFTDSRSSAGLQLADIIAGAFTDAARYAIRGCPGNDRYRDKLWHGFIQNAPVALLLWPDSNFHETAHEWKGTNLTEELDYITSEMGRENLDPRRKRKRRSDA